MVNLYIYTHTRLSTNAQYHTSKHCGNTGPSLSKYHFAEASPYHAIHLSVTSLFSLNVTLTSNLLHVALKLALLQPLQTFQDVSLDSLGLGSENSLYNRHYHLQSGERALKHVSQFDVTTSLHRTSTSSLSKMAAKSHRFGRDGPVFREPLLESADSEFVPIIHLYKC